MSAMKRYSVGLPKGVGSSFFFCWWIADGRGRCVASVVIEFTAYDRRKEMSKKHKLIKRKSE